MTRAMDSSLADLEQPLEQLGAEPLTLVLVG